MAANVRRGGGGVLPAHILQCGTHPGGVRGHAVHIGLLATRHHGYPQAGGHRRHVAGVCLGLGMPGLCAGQNVPDTGGTGGPLRPITRGGLGALRPLPYLCRWLCLARRPQVAHDGFHPGGQAVPLLGDVRQARLGGPPVFVDGLRASAVSDIVLESRGVQGTLRLFIPRPIVVMGGSNLPEGHELVGLFAYRLVGGHLRVQTGVSRIGEEGTVTRAGVFGLNVVTRWDKRRPEWVDVAWLSMPVHVASQRQMGGGGCRH